MTVYRIFDIAIACDFPVPGLTEIRQPKKGVSTLFQMGAGHHLSP
jgi:hypothetical protein